MEGGNLIELTDPRLFEHPWAYMCEPGLLEPHRRRARATCAAYLLKGGFLVIDDFFNHAGRLLSSGATS